VLRYNFVGVSEANVQGPTYAVLESPVEALYAITYIEIVAKKFESGVGRPITLSQIRSWCTRINGTEN